MCKKMEIVTSEWDVYLSNWDVQIIEVTTMDRYLLVPSYDKRKI